MPKNAKYVCYKHRHVSKQHGLCPICRRQLFCVGLAAKIPRKIDDAGWKDLRDWVIQTRQYNIETNEPTGPRTFKESFDQTYSDSIGRK